MAADRLSADVRPRHDHFARRSALP